MISLENAYKNIVKDEGWQTNFLIILGVMVLTMILPALFSMANSTGVSQNTTLTPQQLVGGMFGSTILMIGSLLGSIFITGVQATYLRNLIVDKAAPILNIKQYFTDILASGLKTYAAMIIYFIPIYVVIFMLLAIGFVFAKGGAAPQALIILITLVIIAVLLLIAFSLCIPLLSINYSSKNFKFSALFDFISATKYFGKDYWIAMLIMFGIGIATYIVMGIVMGILFLAGFKGANGNHQMLVIVASLLLSPVSVFLILIYQNLLSQIYYSKVEKA